MGAPGERLGLRTHTHGERKGRGREDSNREREGPKGGGGGTDHRQDQPSRGSGSQEGQRMGAAQAHPFDENAHWQTRWDPTSAHRPGAALKSATSVRASSFKSALSFFSHCNSAFNARLPQARWAGCRTQEGKGGRGGRVPGARQKGGAWRPHCRCVPLAEGRGRQGRVSTAAKRTQANGED